MTATNTNKQPMFVDRPLLARTRLTNQVVGNNTDLNVQGGQSPGLLVDMDATLSSDNNSGGVVDSITILRDDTSDAVHADYTINSDTSGTFIGLTKGQIVYVENTGVLGTPAESGQGYYTYTGNTALNVVNTSIHFSGVASPTASGFTFNSLSSTNLPAVTFVVYHTRGTTVPIPGDGDYVPVFSKTVPTNSGFVDCSDVMPELA